MAVQEFQNRGIIVYNGEVPEQKVYAHVHDRYIPVDITRPIQSAPPGTPPIVITFDAVDLNTLFPGQTPAVCDLTAEPNLAWSFPVDTSVACVRLYQYCKEIMGGSPSRFARWIVEKFAGDPTAMVSLGSIYGSMKFDELEQGYKFVAEERMRLARVRLQKGSSAYDDDLREELLEAAAAEFPNGSTSTEPEEIPQNTPDEPIRTTPRSMPIPIVNRDEAYDSD